MNEKETIVLTAPMRTIVPVIKVAGDSCNMRCLYCFYHLHDQTPGKVMPASLLEKFIGEYLEIFPGEICLNWHGGEPLLAGIHFFEKIVEFEEKYNREERPIRNTIQTNGTLISEAWASFFLEHRFGVGVSIDGGEKSHSRFRKMVSGKSSFTRTLRGIELLRSAGIEPAVIQTVTHSNTEMAIAKENFAFFFEELKIQQLGINFFHDVGGTNNDVVGESVTSDDIVRLLKTYFECWLAHNDSHIRIREIDHLISGVMGKRATTCNWSGSCTGFFCLDADGTVYPSCDRMSGRNDLAIGNLWNTPLREILNGRKRVDYAERVNAMPSACHKCRWLLACYNGCALHREESPIGRYLFCDAREQLFEYVERRLKEFSVHSQSITT